MLDWMRTGKQGIGAVALAGMVFAWLALFCGHCFAAVAAHAAHTVLDADHCQHVSHPCCDSDPGHGCGQDGQFQALPLTVPDAAVVATGHLQPFSEPLLSQLAPTLRSPLSIRAGPAREHPAWKTPPLYLFHRVLRD